MPSVTELLQTAAAHHRAGALPEAARAYLAVLEREPEHPDALQLLGMVAHRMGRTAEGLELVERALRADKRHEVAHANRGLLLLALGHEAEGERALRRALRLRPGFGRAALSLGELLTKRGQPDEALRLLAAVAAKAPEDALLRAALHTLRQVRVRTLLSEGRAAEAVPLLSLLLAGEPARETWLLFVDVLAQLPRLPDLPDLTEGLGLALHEAFTQPHLDLQRLERPARAAVEGALPTPAEGLGDLDDPELLAFLARRLDDVPLVHPWLRRTVVASPGWERRLVALRDHLLGSLAEGVVPYPELFVSIAMQAWITEGAWPAPPEALREALAELDPESLEGTLARSLLGSLDPSEPACDDPLLEELLAQQLGEPRRATALAEELPSLGISDDAVSQAVAAQYEANPYPRLVHVHQRPARPLRELLRGRLGADHLARLPEAPRVLVAGCGTGQHPLSTATRIAGARVTAVDLSRASLGRAAREAERRGVRNVRFVQADILALDGLGALEPGPFDLIESGGVLHHLADPEAGLRSLLAHLAPHGLLRLGLYSERGRADVIAARELARERGWTDDAAGIRRARQEILALPEDHPARGLVHSFDFYSLSGARDLFLHACEHRYTPAGLAELLERHDLAFLGFEHGQASVARRYRERWPEDPAQRDLARWEELEREHPRSFSGMFQLWCAPRRAATGAS